MKICLIVEGCYPYVVGGVSAWVQMLIRQMPEHQFLLVSIGAQSKQRGQFRYEIPSNVTELREYFLDEAIEPAGSAGPARPLTEAQRQALLDLVRGTAPDWPPLFELFGGSHPRPVQDFLMSADFLDLVRGVAETTGRNVPFKDLFWTLRSMLLPALELLRCPVPEADVYHTVATGYAGLLGAKFSYFTRKPFLVTEHGIYTREREEEIIRAEWVVPSFKSRWIRFFYMLSEEIYRRAFRVSSLFYNARRTQIEMGCDGAKCIVIPNGVQYQRFCDIPLKEEDGWVDIGAVVRLAPIKDVKTMVYAFFELASRVPNVRLHIMGGVDDEGYANECYALVEQLQIKNLLFTGRVDVVQYMQKLDFTILTSISEGQPLSVLESMAARRPCVTTEVGCCRELLEGAPGDTFGIAGYCVPPMYRQGLADAMEKMCASRARREEMGRIGQRRVDAYFHHEQMLANYQKMYDETAKEYHLE